MPDIALLNTALLTIVLELPVFWLAGYRKARELFAFAAVNLISNLLLNENLPVYTPTWSYWAALALGEVLVVFLEFALMRYVVKEQQLRLLKVICSTNAVSLAVGLMLFW